MKLLGVKIGKRAIIDMGYYILGSTRLIIGEILTGNVCLTHVVASQLEIMFLYHIV